MKLCAHILWVSIAFAVVGCARGEPPTPEEVGRALNELRDNDFSDAFLRALADAGALLDDEPDAAAVAKPSASARPGAGTPQIVIQVIVEHMDCNRVDPKSYDCSVVWRSREAKASTTGRYRLTHGPQKWSAVHLDK